jgi:hypothetical protein
MNVPTNIERSSELKQSLLFLEDIFDFVGYSIDFAFINVGHFSWYFFTELKKFI